MKSRVMVLCLAVLALGIAGCSDMGGKIETDVSKDATTLPLACGNAGQEPCMKCDENYFLEAGSCVEACPSGKEGVDGVCVCAGETVLDGEACVASCPEPKVAEAKVCTCPEGVTTGACAPKLIVQPIKIAQLPKIEIPKLVIMCQAPLVKGEDGKCGCPTGYPTISDDGKSCNDHEYVSKLEGWWPCQAVNVKDSDPGCACPPFESKMGKACESTVGIGKHDCPAPFVWRPDGKCTCPPGQMASPDGKSCSKTLIPLSQTMAGDEPAAGSEAPAESGTSIEAGSSAGATPPVITPPVIKLKTPALLK